MCSSDSWWSVHVAILVLAVFAVGLSACKAFWLWRIHRQIRKLEITRLPPTAGSGLVVKTYQLIRRA